MKVKIGQAVKLFFGKSSFEMIFFEAIANALDADAIDISIDIRAEALNQPNSIKITICDNGIGFTDVRYRKFSNLLDVDENTHKGIGRLVYLCYFNNIKITSYYENNKLREFEFNENFKEEDVKISQVDGFKSGTKIIMSDCSLDRLHSYQYLQPNYLKKRILEEFYSQLFKLKQNKSNIKITINSHIEDKDYNEELNNNDIPDFETVELDSSITLIDKFYLHYFIKEVDISETTLITAITVENRTLPNKEIISEENKPKGYFIVFLLYSDFFNGKVDSARQKLEINESELQEIKHLFRKKVASILEEQIPNIAQRNKEVKINLVNKFPHLSGYFNTETIGYAAKTDILKNAQEQFFKDQKELLEATSLTDEQYKQSIELSARSLTEYILFRQITIEKLKKTTKENSEYELHNLFMTPKVQFNNKNMVNDIYSNNAWLLDDKYMTYETILSDKEIGELIKYITSDENIERDADRPDMALVFSNNPETSNIFDLVIVEIKKRGISLEENMKTVTQLEKRARKLMEYYKNRIQRIWYYGIIEFNEKIELHLAGEYRELYSLGKIYYKETQVAISLSPKVTLPIQIFIWDIDAIIKDADARNSAFLRLIKSKFI